MEYKILKSKIHTLFVTEANIEYNGSITIDSALMEAAKIKKYEQVFVNNATNGARIMTYVLPGERNSGMVCMNGGAALHAKEGDIVHVLTFCSLQEEELESFIPCVVFTDENNHVQSIEDYI